MRGAHEEQHQQMEHLRWREFIGGGDVDSQPARVVLVVLIFVLLLNGDALILVFVARRSALGLVDPHQDVDDRTQRLAGKHEQRLCPVPSRIAL